MMNVVRKLAREPLMHFLLIGAAVFAIYAYVGGRESDAPEQIVVSEGRVDQLARVFAKTWQRPPTQEELRGLIEAYIKEEIFYREAVKLGLDRDDTLVRRRMQQKVEFLTEPSEQSLKADDEELQTYLDDNKDAFRAEPVTAFQQVFINPANADAPADLRAKRHLSELRATPANADFRTLGDTTLLPAELPPSPHNRIAATFGTEFVRALGGLPRDQWAGPVKSTYGLHLVRVTDHRDAYIPKLQDIRTRVERKWRTKKRQEFKDAQYAKLRSRYSVVLPESGKQEGRGK